jgi:error-prone DNA polymerase
VVAFSAFGFPKSHAAAFGLLAYQSAWLFHYHPIEYYTALFNNQPMGFYSLDALGRDAARHDVHILLPDINTSDVWCTVENDAARVGLGFIREWNAEKAEQVVEDRERRGPYRSLGDLVRRAPATLSRNALEHLVWVGGCDGFGLTRRELLWQVGLWLPPKHDRESTRVRRQLELPLNQPHEDLRFGGVDQRDKLLAEYAVLGFAASGHPLTLLAGSLPHGLTRSDQLPLREHGDKIEVVGLVVARQRPQTAKGFVFVLMEDEAGMINAILRPDVYERDRLAVRGEPFLWIVGTLAKDDGTLNIIAEEVRALTVRRTDGKTDRRKGTSPVDPATLSPGHSAPTNHEPSTHPYRFLRSMRQLAPGSKDWG